jgi:hypothetical protein
MATQKWSTPETAFAVITGTSAFGSLANTTGRVLSSDTVGSTQTSGVVQNATPRYTHAIFELYFADTAPYGGTPVVGGFWGVYALPVFDGTNVTDGDSTDAPTADSYIGSIGVRPVNEAQRVTSRLLRIPPVDFKVLLQNNSGQAVVASGSLTGTHELRMRRLNLESV